MSRRAFLDPIAENGHVIEQQRHFLHEGFRDVGVNKASVFPGFCAQHDQVMFKDVDNPVAEIDRDFVLRLCYRVATKEAHAKQDTLAIADVLLLGDAGLPLPAQVQFQNRMNLFLHGTRLGVQDLMQRKDWLERAIESDASVPMFEWQSVAIDGKLPIVGAGAYNCEATFTGEHEPFDECAHKIPLLIHALIPQRGSWLSVFGWFRDGAEERCRRFAESIDCLSSERVPTALARFTMDVSENFFLRPSWYRGLDSAAQEDIAERVACGVLADHSGLCLLDSPAITISGRGSVAARSWT